MATRDELTGLMNRRGLLRHLDRLNASPRYSPTPLAIAMVDVDHFKAYNDAHGPWRVTLA